MAVYLDDFSFNVEDFRGFLKARIASALYEFEKILRDHRGQTLASIGSVVFLLRLFFCNSREANKLWVLGERLEAGGRF
jgi:hypothetical protein